MVRRALAALALCVMASTASAQAPPDAALDLPAAVAEDLITVSSDYAGSYITVFGFNPDRYGRGDIVVVLRGPNERATVMRKRRMYGIWVNGDPVHFSSAPSFFAVMSSRPLASIVSPQGVWAYGLDPAASAQLESAVPAGADPSAYRAALTRLRTQQGLYQVYHGQPAASAAGQPRRAGLTMYPGGLFRAVVRLPANAPIDTYHADTYLFRDGRLILRQRIPISIARGGIERQIHDLATSASFLYGVLTVLLALASGWVAALLFRRT